MKEHTRTALGLCLLFCGVATLAAQQNSDGTTPPPKVFVITREYVKPGKAGSLHDQSESAFVHAMAAANWPTHYFAAESLSGRPRVLFFTAYDSFEAFEKDNSATMGNATLSAALDSAGIADGELLTGSDTSATVYREDLSLHPAVKIEEMRYLEISRYVVRPGRRQEWEALVKGYANAYGKAIPDAHWAMFESMYGEDNGGVYLLIVPMKSMAETDHSISDSKKVETALGESEMKRLQDLEASCVESSQTNLFMFNPKMSYPPDEWIKADPFWSKK